MRFLDLRTVISWRLILMVAGVSALLVGCLVKTGRVENLLLANALFALSSWRLKDFRKKRKKQARPREPIGFPESCSKERGRGPG